MAFLNDIHKNKHNIVGHILRLHKPNGKNINAKPIFHFVLRILEPAPASQTVDGEAPSQDTFLNIYDSLPEFPDMPIIAGNVASEIACKIVNEVDTHNTTLSVLKILKQYSWETKVALTVATFVLTFGDSGLNMTADNVDKSPLFNEHEFKGTSNLIKAMVEATSCIVDYENLPTTFFTSENRKIKNANTDFIVAVYMIVRAVVAAAAHNITLSSKGVRFETGTSDPKDLFNWAEKLKSISNDLKNMLPKLHELLEVNIEIEAYNSVKEIVQREYHIDNMEVLNALISDNDMPLLYHYHNWANKRVHLGVLQGKSVLLLIADPDMHVTIIEIIDMLSEVYPYAKGYEIVWIPIIQQSQQQMVATEGFTKFAIRKKPWYSVRNPGMIKKEVIKFFKDDWGFNVDPIVAVLDRQGKLFHQNAMDMIYMWRSMNFPFKNLWKENGWRLDLLFAFTAPKIFEWIDHDQYIYIHGGDNIDWIRNFTSAVHEVARESGFQMEVFYVGRSGDDNVEKLTKVMDYIKSENLGFSVDIYRVWYFWSRVETMMSSLRSHKNVADHADFVLQELQRLRHYDRSNDEWSILAKGSRIVVLGRGEVALSTLQQFELWKELASEKGFEVGFESHYHLLYRQ